MVSFESRINADYFYIDMIKDAIVSVSRSLSRFGSVVELFWCFGCLVHIATVRFHGATTAITITRHYKQLESFIILFMVYVTDIV